MRPSPKRAEALNIAPDHAMAFFGLARVESPFTFDMNIRGNYCDLKGTNL